MSKEDLLHSLEETNSIFDVEYNKDEDAYFNSSQFIADHLEDNERQLIFGKGYAAGIKAAIKLLGL